MFRSNTGSAASACTGDSAAIATIHIAVVTRRKRHRGLDILIDFICSPPERRYAFARVQCRSALITTRQSRPSSIDILPGLLQSKQNWREADAASVHRKQALHRLEERRRVARLEHTADPQLSRAAFGNDEE